MHFQRRNNKVYSVLKIVKQDWLRERTTLQSASILLEMARSQGDAKVKLALETRGSWPTKRIHNDG